jgi:MYXO-CTERM domain-containing protein
MRTWLVGGALVLLVLALPTAVAEFGPTSDEGWPVGADGDPIEPPVRPSEMPVTPADRFGEDQAQPYNKAGPVTAFPYYPLLTAEVERLAEEHPDKVKLTSAGQSEAGLDLWLLEIANFDDVESGDAVPLEERETVYIDGGTHSNEYSAVYFVTEIAQFLLDEYETNETAQWIVDNRHTYILPMVNPDGSNAFGRLNANAVNINRNFPAIWGEVDESPVLNNPGPEPASEAETQVVLDVLDEIEPDYVNSIHCCGNLWLHPYGHEDFQPTEDDLEMFTRICDEVFYDVREDCGPIWSTIYPASGTTADTGYDLHGASSWTYEMSGRGAIAPWGQPVITEDVREQERESWRGVIHAMKHTEKYGAHPTVQRLDGTDEGLVATVHNDGYQPLREGTLTVGNATQQLPDIGAGNTTTVDLEGAFEAGETPLRLDYQKRDKHSPNGTRTRTVELEAAGDTLSAVLEDDAPEAPVEPASAEDPDESPAPGVLGVLAAAGLGLAGASRRRAGNR